MFPQIQQPTARAAPRHINVITNTPSSTMGKLSSAQVDHIKKVRSLVESSSELFYHDWTRILVQPRIYGKKRGTLDPSTFMVKASAAWVPHLLIDGFHPYCPTCKKPVPTIKFSWVDVPMVLFGMSEHRYLDTVRYHCRICDKTFRATDKTSLALDQTGNCRATFGLYLLKRCAVDEDLYQCVTGNLREQTSRKALALRQMSMQKFISRITKYYQLSLQLAHKPTATDNTNKRGTLDGFVVAGAGVQDKRTHQLLRSKRSELSRARLLSNGVAATVQISEISGIGTKKLARFRELGIHTGQQFLQLYQDPSENPDKYQDLQKLFRLREAAARLKDYAEKIQRKLDDIDSVRAQALATVNTLEKEVESLELEANEMVEVSANPIPTATMSIKEFRPDFADPQGYNGKFFSNHYIESLCHTHFQKQKPGMKHRMEYLSGEILSLDTVYGPAKRVAVYIDGKPFRPWTGLSIVMNEHGQVIWFGYLKGSESISEIAPHLLKLKTRIDRLPGPNVRAIYVDNCCNVRVKLQKIFGLHVFVLLDVFHWMARWDEVVRDKQSEQYGVFRALMSRAILQASPDEYAEQRDILVIKLKRQPTVKEILQECNTKTPPPDEMKQSVLAIVEYFLIEDARKTVANIDVPVPDSQSQDEHTGEQQSATTDTAPEQPSGSTQESTSAVATPSQQVKQRLFFKDAALVRKKVAQQLKHIKCMCDPEGLVLHRKVPNGKVYCARGSSKNERFNRKVNDEVLCCSIVGVNRADRCTWTLCDEGNTKANVQRRGAKDYHSTNLESMAYTNSLVASVDPDRVLPFQDVSLPTQQPDSGGEDFGFELNSEDRNLANANTTELERLDSEDSDKTNDGDVADEAAVPGVDSAADDDVIDLTVRDDVERIGNIIHAACDPEIGKPESTFATFSRMTGNNPWLPFSDSNDEISREERRLFEEMKQHYSRHASRDHRKGFHAFSIEWDKEAGRRYLLRLRGEKVITIYSKTAKQMAEYYDKIQDLASAAASVTENGLKRLHEVNSVLKNARRRMPPAPAFAVQPFVYPQAALGTQAYTHIGTPLTMNAQLAFPYGILMNPASNNGRAPYLPMLPRGQVIPTTKHPPKIFNRICKKCGRAKSEHPTKKFGSIKCQFSHCGKCNQHQDFHVARGIPMGLDCTLLSA